MNSIFNRKSIRKFKEKTIEPEKIEKLLKAGMQAPSAMNTQPWEFLVVENKESIIKISEMSKYAKPAYTSACCIITLCNMKHIKEKKMDDWFPQDMSACTENILIQAVEEELGAVWLGTYPDEERCEYLQKHFNIPKDFMPFSVIVLGYPDKEYTVEDRFDPNRIHYETY
ncbi:MAG: nitroreductase family protein [archaeon]|nr:nitroreductase family protein [archaeon]